MRIAIFLAVLLTCTFVGCPVAEAQGGKFPGRGSRAAWVKASAVYNKANYYCRVGKISAALPLFEESIHLYPFDPDFYMNAAIAYGKNPKTLDQAEKLIKQAIGLEPTAYDLQSEYAVILARRGRLVKAREVLRRTSTFVKTPVQSTRRDLKLKELDQAIRQTN